MKYLGNNQDEKSIVNQKDLFSLPIIRGTGENSALGGSNNCVASGIGSFAFGYDAQALNNYSFAVNRGIASGSNSIAMGGKLSGFSQTTANGTASVAIGQSTQSLGQYSISIGSANTASGSMAVAIGNLNEVSGDYAVSMGYRTKASSANQYVFGKDNIEDTNRTYLFILGNGTSASAKSNAMTVDWNGNITLTGGITLGKGTINEVTLSATELKQLKTLIQE